jgi:hypothetical protein
MPSFGRKSTPTPLRKNKLTAAFIHMDLRAGGIIGKTYFCQMARNSKSPTRAATTLLKFVTSNFFTRAHHARLRSLPPVLPATRPEMRGVTSGSSDPMTRTGCSLTDFVGRAAPTSTWCRCLRPECAPRSARLANRHCVHLRGRGSTPNLPGMRAPKKKAPGEKLRPWRVALMRSRSQLLGIVYARDEKSAEAKAVAALQDRRGAAAAAGGAAQR